MGDSVFWLFYGISYKGDGTCGNFISGGNSAVYGVRLSGCMCRRSEQPLSADPAGF